MSGAPNLTKLISVYLRQIQKLEDAATEVYKSRILANAVGVQLDGLGDLVGASRRGLSDDDFRTAIATQILLNVSNGTVPEIQAIFASELGPGYALELREYPTHSAEFDAILTPTVDAAKVPFLRYLLRTAKAAGVYATLRTASATPVFRFAGGSGSARGFGVGKFSSVG